MNEELMITKEDLVNWLNRPPSNDDLDLIGFITTRLENFYKLEQENKQLKERIEYLERSNNRREDMILEYRLEDIGIVAELEEWLKEEWNITSKSPKGSFYEGYDTCMLEMKKDIQNKIQELKEKYK